MEVQMCWKMKKCAEASAAATGVLVTIWGFPENLQSVVIKQVWFIRGWPEMGRWKRTRWKMFSKPLWKQIYEKILGHRKVRQGEMVLYGILGGTNYTLFCLQPFFPKKMWSRLWIPEHNLWWKTGWDCMLRSRKPGQSRQPGTTW